MSARAEKLSSVEAHYNTLRELIQSAETLGLIVLTDKHKEFPRVADHIYEPVGTNWILKPVYADPDASYWNRAYLKCKPLSQFKDILA